MTAENQIGSEEFVRQANIALEENRFEAARDLLRRASLNSMPSREVLANLSVAETEDELGFRRVIARLYPSSLDCRLSEIHSLLEAGRPSLALDAACELLEERSWGLREQIRIRLMRFKASTESGDGELLAEDFLEIWDAAQIVSPAARFRKGLVETISRIGNSASLSRLADLSEHRGIPEDVVSFLRAKASELDALARVQRQLGTEGTEIDRRRETSGP